MKEVNSVRRRIQRRRYNEPKKQHGIFKFIYRTMMVAMLGAVLTLAYFINDKMGLVELPQELKNINFGMVSEWLPFDQWFSSKEDTTVNATPTYSLLKDNQYSNGSNQATLLGDGVVLHVEENGTSKNSVTIRHDNGVIATYGHLDSVQTKQDERLLKGKTLGTYNEYVSIDLVKNNQTIAMSDAFAEE